MPRLPGFDTPGRVAVMDRLDHNSRDDVPVDVHWTGDSCSFLVTGKKLAVAHAATGRLGICSLRGGHYRGGGMCLRRDDWVDSYPRGTVYKYRSCLWSGVNGVEESIWEVVGNGHWTGLNCGDSDPAREAGSFCGD